MADELFSSRLVIKIDDLLKVHRVEKQRIEFKASWNTGGTSWQILHSITAFANDFLNDNGGYIVIGVEDGPSDDGQVQVCGVPQQNLDKIQKQIQALCKGNIRPLYYPILSPEIYNEKHVLVIWATASDSGPHECRESPKGEFQFYIRRGPQTIKASQDEKRQLLVDHNKAPFDDRIARHPDGGKDLSEDDIDSDLVQKFLKDIGSNIQHQDLAHPRQLYKNMKLVKVIAHTEKEGKLIEKLVPRNVSLLFFSQTPDEYFRGAQTDITIYNADGEVTQDMKIKGPIDHQISEVIDFILMETKDEESLSFVQYPKKALREAVVNAFYHRGNESQHCDPVKVRIHTTHIDIISYPGPHQSLKPSHFLEGSDFPPVRTRNRRIGEFLVSKKLAEEKGTGVRTIFRSMKQNGNFTPEFLFDEAYFRVRLPRHPNFMVREILQLITTLKGRGEKRVAVESLLQFLEKNPGIRCDSLFQKLMELHDNDRNHPNVEKYKEFVTDRLERKAALASELDEWSKNPLDIEKGVQIVKSLVKEGATAEDLRKATKIAVDILKEKHHEQRSTLEANQKAHQLIQAMGSVVKTDAYLSYHFAKCKLTLFSTNTRARSLKERYEFSSYLTEAKDCADDAVRLSSEDNNLHRANGFRLLGYIQSRLQTLKKATIADIQECYDEARRYNPKIHINVTFIPPNLRGRYKVPE